MVLQFPDEDAGREWEENYGRTADVFIISPHGCSRSRPYPNDHAAVNPNKHILSAVGMSSEEFSVLERCRFLKDHPR